MRGECGTVKSVFLNSPSLNRLGTFNSNKQKIPMQVIEAQHTFVGEIVDLVAALSGDEREIHPETAIASAARLAGSFMFRSFDLELAGVEPGTLILSKEADERGPHLVGILAAALKMFDDRLDTDKLGGQHRMMGEEPKLEIAQSLKALQYDAMLKAQSHGLNPVQAAEAAAIATAYVVKECIASIGIDVGFNVGAAGFVEGCKTVPPALQPPSAQH